MFSFMFYKNIPRYRINCINSYCKNYTYSNDNIKIWICSKCLLYISKN